MLRRTDIAIGAGVIGWLVIGFWSLLSYWHSDARCGFVARLNLIDAPGSALFFSAALFCFIISSFYIYRAIKDEEINKGIVGRKLIFLATVVVLLFAFLSPSLNTHDMSFYFSAGRSVSQGLNPFTEGWAMNNIYACPSISSQQHGIMYGPIILAMFGFVYALVGGNPLFFVLLWKFIMLLSFFVFCLLISKIIRLLSDKKINTKDIFVFFSFQPVFIWYWIGNGQLEALWVIFVLTALLYALKRKWSIVFTSLVIGVWVKFIPLLIAPWFVLWWWQETNKVNWKKNIGQALSSLVASVVITYFVWLPFWAGGKTLQSILLQSKWAVNSLFSVLYYSLKPLFIGLFNESAHWWLTRLLHLILFIFAIYLLYPLLKKIYLIFLKRSVWTPGSYIAAIFISLLVFLAIWQKSFWPWYLSSWLLPFGMLLFFTVRSIFLERILIWLSTVPFIFYIIWIINHVTRGTDAPSELWFYYAVFILTWVYPIMQLLKWRKANYVIENEKSNGESYE